MTSRMSDLAHLSIHMYDIVYRYVWTDLIRTSPGLVHTLKTHHISPPLSRVKYSYSYM